MSPHHQPTSAFLLPRRAFAALTLVALAAMVAAIAFEQESMVRWAAFAVIVCTAALMAFALIGRRLATAAAALAGVTGFILLFVTTELSSIPVAYLALGFGGAIIAALLSLLAARTTDHTGGQTGQ